MKIFIFLVFIILNCLFLSCIRIRSTKFDDGSSFLTKEDSSLIKPFIHDSIRNEHSDLSASDVRFEIISAQDVEWLIKKKQFSWVMIISSWCGASLDNLVKGVKLMKHFPADSLQWIVISQDLNLKYLKQDIRVAGFTGTTYLLDPGKYGSKENQKQTNLMKDLQWDIPPRFFYGGGIPKNIIIDKDQKVHFFISGNVITEDTISKYTHLQYFDIKNGK
jgi:hypothetical protein